MANLLTALRVLLIPPVALAFAGLIRLEAVLLLALVLAAIGTDYFDGKVARWLNTASPRGQLFDHTTDFLFVTLGLAGMAYAGVVTPLLPVLIVVAFAQYVIDSYYYYHQKQLRMSVLGRWNGILYFVPIVTLACAGFPLLQRLPVDFAWLVQAMGWLLVLSTVLSIADRALAPLRVRHEAGR